MEATLKRLTNTNKETLGVLTATKGAATFVCKTLELPYKNNLSNISSIPTGTYTVKYTFSPRFKKFTYEILNVPNRKGIRIHSGNYYTQINGCILLGTSLKDINQDEVLDVTESKKTISAFEGFMGRKSFILNIE